MGDEPPPARRLDVEAILRILHQHEVVYVVIGGMGAVMHGWPGVTLDLDVTPSPGHDNLGRLAAALREMDAKLRAPGLDDGVDIPLDERSFDLGTTWTFVTRHGYVDVCMRPDGTQGYEDLEKNAVEVQAFGLTIGVASLADIIRSKRAAGRDRDLAVLPMLERLAGRLTARGSADRPRPRQGEKRQKPP